MEVNAGGLGWLESWSVLGEKKRTEGRYGGEVDVISRVRVWTKADGRRTGTRQHTIDRHDNEIAPGPPHNELCDGIGYRVEDRRGKRPMNNMNNVNKKKRKKEEKKKKEKEKGRKDDEYTVNVGNGKDNRRYDTKYGGLHRYLGR
jgi:hypothetical protein